MKKLLIVVCLIALTGCTGETDNNVTPTSVNFPDNSQTETSLNAPLATDPEESSFEPSEQQDTPTSTTVLGEIPLPTFSTVDVPESPNDLQNGAYETSFGWLVFDDNGVKGLETEDGGAYGVIYGDPGVCENLEAVLSELNAPGTVNQYFETCLSGTFWDPVAERWVLEQ